MGADGTIRGELSVSIGGAGVDGVICGDPGVDDP